ncbi:hypothetical protein M514_14537 [Trichuris suis]|uniref:Uncharacterized protein n=1 Tax=Trichuris suis TaxID=68888 RepID=A0A085NUQ1_9BILA|nr:hypothetical protein M514_14537 [Trichuris suis]
MKTGQCKQCSRVPRLFRLIVFGQSQLNGKLFAFKNDLFPFGREHLKIGIGNDDDFNFCLNAQLIDPIFELPLHLSYVVDRIDYGKNASLTIPPNAVTSARSFFVKWRGTQSFLGYRSRQGRRMSNPPSWANHHTSM